MAIIAFPTVELINTDFQLRWPGQTIHESIYTSHRQVITRGIGVWTGQITFREVETRGEANLKQEMEVFLSQLEGSANTFLIPIPVRQAARFTNPAQALTVSRWERIGSLMRLTFSQATGLLVGDYITIDNNLFQLTTPLVGSRATVSPYRRLPTTTPDPNTQNAITITPPLAVNWSAPVLEARRVSNDAISNPISSDFSGPWTIAFEQAR